MKLSGWGRYPAVEARVFAPRSPEDLRALLKEDHTVIARGNGRAYGDSAINPEGTVFMRHFNRMLAFCPETGQLTAEAGVILGDVIETLLPRGWFPAVTPGTRFVTLGGMIAADVHGKNHHKVGSFASCVDWMEVMDADGAIRRCSRDENADLFEWTLGGMGLTGIIVRAAIRLQRVETGWIRQKTIAAPNLAAAMQAFEAAENATYSVAWIDCLGRDDTLGRSLVMLGEHARLSELAAENGADPFALRRRRKLTIPFDLPSLSLNSLTVRAFNEVYYRVGVRAGKAERLVDWDRYFYPLDTIDFWNRIYGRNGFSQFQCVFPPDRSEAGLREILKAVAAAGAGSFLAVLKKFGPQESRFSFPMEGYTLALDFPINGKTMKLMDSLDRITIEHGGRLYLAKDSRMTAGTLEACDNRAAAFRRMRDEQGLRGRFLSAQSARLSI